MKAIFFKDSIEKNFLGHIFKEIYFDRVYAPYLEGKKDLTVLDIGAHVGMFSLYASKFAKDIYTVEPSKEHFNTMSHMVKYNKLTNVHPINNAIAATNKKATFYHNNNKTMYSLKEAVRTPNLETEEVECITIEKLLNDNNIKQVDFMKLDVEGVEYEILGGSAFRAISERINTLIVESHVWADRHPHQLIESLKNNGYDTAVIPNDASLIVGIRRK